MRNSNVSEEIRRTKDIVEKAEMVFDFVSRTLYASFFSGKSKQG